MRPRRWIHPLPCRPPDPHPLPPPLPLLARPLLPPRPAPPPLPPRLRLPQTAPTPPPVASTSRLASAPSPTRLPEPTPAPTCPLAPPQISQLRQTLDSLPPFPSSTAHGAPRLALYRRRELEGELRLWRRACAQCHALVSSLLASSSSPRSKGKDKAKAWQLELENELKPRIVRLVAETSRLLLHLDHLAAFTDLDRAFFTRERGGYARSLSRAIRAARERGEDPFVDGARCRKLKGVSGSPLRMGEGLGWQRGDEHVAWMVAFEAALRDRSPAKKHAHGADERAVEKFGKLVRAMRMRRGEDVQARPQERGGGDVDERTRRQTPGERIDSHLLAFLTRIMSRVHARLGTPVVGDPTRARLLALNEVELIVEEIRLAEADEGEEVVSMALLESAMSCLEEQASSPQSCGGKTTPVSADHPLFRKIEEDVEILVSRLDSMDHAPRRSTRSTPHLMRDRRAHILYTTIRFLLLRARIARSRASSRQSLLSASQLYSILLGLSSKSASSRTPAATARLRVWQTSALYRLVWAHMPHSTTRGPSSASASASQRKGSTTSFLEPGEFDRETATRVLDLLDLTRAAMVHVPPPPARPANSTESFRQVRDTRLIGVSTAFLRRFLETLVVPFAPRPSPSPQHSHSHRHSHHRDSRHSFTPTHDLLDRTLRTLLSLRWWDSTLPVAPRSRPQQVDHHAWEYRLFSRPSLVVHLVRGWVLAPSASPSSSQARSGRAGDGRDHVVARLSSLLAHLSSLVRLPANEAWQAEYVGRLAEDVEWAVGEVVEWQWGRNRKMRGEEGWREEVDRIVRKWKEEMKEVEAERRKKDDEARKRRDATPRKKPPFRRSISYPPWPSRT